MKLHIFVVALLIGAAASAAEFHVAVTGDDAAPGTKDAPLRTVGAAADLAQPGDTITVHEGAYRERVNPPRGGTSSKERITYRAAQGERVVLKGSEPMKGWEKAEHDTWRVEVPNTFFGDFNPYADLIQGDWFAPQGREHHTGAVYLDEHWLTEAVSKADVLAPFGTASDRYVAGASATLLNVGWFRPEGGAQVPANSFTQQEGIQTAPCTAGGECIGWIEHGDWVRYEGVDFGAGAKRIEFLSATVTQGGVIEVRLDAPDGPLLGSCHIPHTGGWQAWKRFYADITPTAGKQTVCLRFRAGDLKSKAPQLWFAEVDDATTTIWAQFPDVDPNAGNVEINVRQSVFYPEKTGINYITVHGFTMMHAATPWAPPTAEQVGLVGTNWSKGWVIENNDIRYSTCVGITLGKYGDEFDNTSANTAEGYVKTIERALENGWDQENVGSHWVSGNTIAHCEQAGIVGSLGAAFSHIQGNHIHDIHVRRLFSGAEMAGIKLHGAIDTTIIGNHIHHSCLGIWLDWMAQGTRVTRNLLHDNGPSPDLFLEVNHGPYLIDNNLSLSGGSLLNVSQGGAYAHNLFTGAISPHPELNRETPYHPAHSTQVAGLAKIEGGDDRFYNNLFAGGSGLAPYDNVTRPCFMAGNVFLGEARPAAQETDAVVLPDAHTCPTYEEGVLNIDLPEAALRRASERVSTEMLGKAAVPDLPYERGQCGGRPISITSDITGAARGETPLCGPFEELKPGMNVVRIPWADR